MSSPKTTAASVLAITLALTGCTSGSAVPSTAGKDAGASPGGGDAAPVLHPMPDHTSDQCAAAPGTWVPTPTFGAPPAAMNNLVRWTGKELLVLPPDNRGGAFLDPCTFTWRAATSPTGDSGQLFADSDAGRLYFAYSWTTRSVFASFDPSTNAWRGGALPGMPDVSVLLQPSVAADRGLLLWSPRPQSVHTWTDADLRDPLGYWYDVATNQWRDTRSGGRLAGRFQPSVAWTGKQLFVWGGGLPVNYPSVPDGLAGLTCPHSMPFECRFGDGALYDPARDAWTPVSAAGAPTARQAAEAFWTGSRVVVWGGHGYDGTGHFAQPQDGAVYDPAADRWSPISPPPTWDQAPPIQPLPDAAVAALFVRGDLAYDAEQDKWIALPHPPPRPPAATCAIAWRQSNALVYDCQTERPENRRWEIYSLTARNWKTVPYWREPGRQAGAIIWTGTRMIVWGGWKEGPTPSNPCINVGPGVGCDPPGPDHIPVNEGAVFTP